MRERPILFSAPMVRAILSGTKCQTRRPIGLSELHASDTPGYDWTWRGRAPIRSVAQQQRHPHGCWQDVSHADLLALCPYGEPGDRLWVRETWRTEELPSGLDGIRFRADDAFVPIEDSPEAADQWGEAHENGKHGTKWRPSIFMRRWASRLTLEVAGVRVERLHDISDADILAEGVTRAALESMWPATEDLPADVSPRELWGCGWTHINGAESWHANPWVWVVGFKRIDHAAEAA